MEGFVIDWLMGILGGLGESLQSVVNSLTMNSAQLEESFMFDAVGVVNDILTPVALIITTICFLTEFIKMSIRMDVMKFEYVLALFFKLCLSKAVIDISMDIMLLVYQTVSEWIGSFSAFDADGGGAAVMERISDSLKDALDGLGFWAFLGFVFTNLLLSAAILIITLLINVIAWGRLFEIYVNLAVAPIPFAFLISEGGGNGITKHFVMSYAGVCIQGLLMVVCIKIYQYMLLDILDAGAASGDASEIIGQLLLASLVLLISVTKCGQWGKQILNAM